MACSLLAAAASLLCSAGATAQTPGIHFVWQRPAASMCPLQSVLEADVEELMGRSVFTTAADARMIVHGAIEDGSNGVRVHIEAASARGEQLGTRELSASAGQCASLRGAIGLVLTMFAEYDAPSSSASDDIWGFGAAAALASEPLPRFAISVGPALMFEHDRFLQLRVSAAYWPPVSIETARGVGATLEAFSLTLRACARVWDGFGLCAGAEGGALSATPRRLIGPARQVRLLAHGLLDARWEVSLARALRADFALGPLLSFSRPAISYLRADGERMAVYRPQLMGIIFRLTLIILDE